MVLSQPWGDFGPQRMFGNVWNAFGFLSVCFGGRVLLASRGGEARDAAKHPTMHKTVPTMKNYSSPSVNSAEVEKLWSHQVECFKVKKRGKKSQGPSTEECMHSLWSSHTMEYYHTSLTFKMPLSVKVINLWTTKIERGCQLSRTQCFLTLKILKFGVISKSLLDLFRHILSYIMLPCP